MEKNNYINDLSEFINSNFESSDDLKINVKNIRNLFSYVSYNNPNIEFSVLDAELLLINCPSLSKTIKTVKSHKELNSIFSGSENEIFKDLYNNLIEAISIADKKEEYLNSLEDDISYNAYERRSKTVSEDIFNYYLKEISKRPLLSPEEEKILAYEIRNGNENAKIRFIESNLRLVVSIAKRYTNRGLDILDLIEEGNIGLMMAVDRFDPDKGYKFSTYATYWIRQAMTRSIAKYGRSIRISVDATYQLNRINRIQRYFKDELQREATDEELSSVLGLSRARIKELKELPEDSISLNAPVGEDKDTTIMDYVAAEGNFEEDLINEISTGEFMEIFNKVNLSPKERKVLLLRAGYFDEKERTLEEIGDMYGVTRERIRQVEAKALKKVRSDYEVKKFIDNSRLYVQDYIAQNKSKKAASLTNYINNTNMRLQKKKN